MIIAPAVVKLNIEKNRPLATVTLPPVWPEVGFYRIKSMGTPMHRELIIINQDTKASAAAPRQFVESIEDLSTVFISNNFSEDGASLRVRGCFGKHLKCKACFDLAAEVVAMGVARPAVAQEPSDEDTLSSSTPVVPKHSEADARAWVPPPPSPPAPPQPPPLPPPSAGKAVDGGTGGSPGCSEQQHEAQDVASEANTKPGS